MIDIDNQRAGWRRFHCEECGVTWESTTRDRHSPSMEMCPACGAERPPFESHNEKPVFVDWFGNLVFYEENRLGPVGFTQAEARK